MILSAFDSKSGKRRINFPAANHYHVDVITHVNFMTGKLSDQYLRILKAVFQLKTIAEGEAAAPSLPANR